MSRTSWFGGLTLAGVLTLGLVGARHSTPQLDAVGVVGTWTLVSAKANGKAVDVAAGTTVLKHITPTDFVFVYYTQQGLITVAGGGRYRLTGNHYEETVEYGVGEGMAPYIGKTEAFTLRLDGNRWYHSGTEHDGTVVEEVWERARR